MQTFRSGFAEVMPTDSVPNISPLRAGIFDKILSDITPTQSRASASSIQPGGNSDGSGQSVNNTVIGKVGPSLSRMADNKLKHEKDVSLVELSSVSDVGSLVNSVYDCDIPPLPLDYPKSDSDLLRLQKRRIHNERVRIGLLSEHEAFESLLKEEETLVNRANKTTEMILVLADKSQQLDQRYKSVEDLYHANQEKLALLEKAVEGINKQWQKEASEFNSHSARLQKLRTQKSKLDVELIEVSEQCATLTTKLSSGLEEKARLDSMVARITKENDSSVAQINYADKETQTSFSFTVLQDIELIHKELEKQRATMKNVREAIELVKRCT